MALPCSHVDGARVWDMAPQVTPPSPCNSLLTALSGRALQEDDVIGVLTASEKISELKPLGDRILIKVSKEKGQPGSTLT
eukprot:1003-Chlamydomonas_euryale.AAC.6